MTKVYQKQVPAMIKRVSSRKRTQKKRTPARKQSQSRRRGRKASKSSKRKRRSTTKKSKSKGKKSRVSHKKCSLDVTSIAYLNSIMWDVTDYKEDALHLGDTVDSNILKKVMCEGKLTLLLPAAHKTFMDPAMMLYENQVKVSRKKVTVGDILQEIWKFYNYNHLTKDDLVKIVKNVPSQAELAQKHLDNFVAKSVTFKSFLDNHTLFNGIVEQSKGTYMVRLAPNMSPAMPSVAF